jgi:NADH:ubiquinone reductase (H+-translocating)
MEAIMTRRILVLGAGFAGLWSAVGAARTAAAAGASGDIEITVVNRTPYHNIRVRNYESDLSDVCVPLGTVLSPIGVRVALGDVTAVDTAAHQVQIATTTGERRLAYDRLVLALGSELVRPPIPGIGHTFDVDTYAAATRLDAHIRRLATQPALPGRFTAVIVGAGLTGIEVATEMPVRLAAARAPAPAGEPVRVILADRHPYVGSDMGEHARPVIEDALSRLGIETRLNVTVEQIDENDLLLSSGERIAAATVVWCGGLRANPLPNGLTAARDELGRLLVDDYLRCPDLADVFAAGDIARVMLDGTHASVMSCQHGRPMGRYAGHNASADLLGEPLLPLRIDWYTTILDLGPCGAVYTRGWDRQVIATGATAKATKRMINGERIYPPRSQRPEDILAAAAPVIQPPPEIGDKLLQSARAAT